MVGPPPQLQVLDEHGWLAAAFHAVLGAWLLFCVVFNHAQCALTAPGSTLDTDRYVSDVHCAMCMCV